MIRALLLLLLLALPAQAEPISQPSPGPATFLVHEGQTLGGFFFSEAAGKPPAVHYVAPAELGVPRKGDLILVMGRRYRVLVVTRLRDIASLVGVLAEENRA